MHDTSRFASRAVNKIRKQLLILNLCTHARLWADIGKYNLTHACIRFSVKIDKINDEEDFRGMKNRLKNFKHYFVLDFFRSMTSKQQSPATGLCRKCLITNERKGGKNYYLISFYYIL